MNQRTLANPTSAAKRQSATVLAMAVASAAMQAMLSTHAHAATLTWTGNFADPNSATYTATSQGTAAGFTSGQNLYLWNNSATNSNWSGATQYTVGDNVIFTDAPGGGKDIRISSGSLNPASMTFAHTTGVTPVLYRFTNSSAPGDFTDASSNILSANTPFGANSGTALLLDDGFLGTVVLRARANGSNTGGNTIVRDGILEISDGGALPHPNNNNNQPNLTLDGGEFRVKVNTQGNTNPANGQLAGTLTVLSDSTLSNGETTRTGGATVWNGPVAMGAGVTLTLKSYTDVRLNLSNMNISNVTGTIRLADDDGVTYGTDGVANTTVVGISNQTSHDALGALIDLGTGNSEILSTGANLTYDWGALTGGANTKLSGSTSASSTTTYSIGARGDNTTYAGTIRDNTTQATGLAALTKVGAGTLTLTGTNTYTGPTTVSGGTLLVSGAAGSISGSASVTVNGNATLSINNATNLNDRLGDAASITLNQGNLVFTGNLAAPTAEAAGQLVIAGGGNALQSLATGAGSPASLTFASLSRTAGVIDFRPAANVNIAFATPPTLVNGIIGGYATANTNDWATLSGSNVAALASYATNTAPAGWAATDNINLTSGGTSAVTASKTINSLRFAGAGTTASISAGQTLNIGTGGILATGAGGATVSGPGAITAGSAAGAELIALVQDAGNTLTISAPITDNGAGAVTLVKAGPGRLLLSGASNSFTGGTSLIGGTLAVGTPNYFPAASNLTLNYGAALDINGNSQTFGTVTLIDGSVLNSAGAASITAATYDVRKGTASAVLSGSGTLTKTTGGTVVLAAANTYTGGTVVTGGVLSTTANGALPNNGTVNVSGGGTLDIGSASHSVGLVTLGNGTTSGGTITGTIGVLSSNTTFDAQNGTISAVLGGAVGLTKAAINTTVTLSGANTYTGPTTVGVGGTPSGTVSINSIANGGLPSAVGASSNAASNLVLNNGILLYTGTGHNTDRLFTLGGAFTITHNGTGALNFTNPGAIAGGGNLLTINGTGTGSIAGTISGGTSVTKGGNGTWALSGASSYTGATTVSGGVLSINSIANGGLNSPIGASASSGGTLILNGGTLRYTGSGHSTDRLFNFNAGSTLDASGTGAVNFTNSDTIPGSLGTAATLTLTGTSTANNTLASAFTNINGATMSLTKTGTGTWVLSGANTYSGATTVNGGKLVLKPAAHGPVLSVTDGFANITSGRLVFDYAGGSSPAATVVPLLQTSAASNFTAGRFRTAQTATRTLGYYDNGTDSLTVMYTYFGDLNLDGRVNGDDYALLDRGDAMNLTGWVNGDVNYDGVIDATDYLRTDTAFGQQTGVLSPALLAQRQSQFGDAYVAQLVASVPEPSSLAACGLALLPLTRRRRGH